MNKKPWPPAPDTGIPSPAPAKDETDYKVLLTKYMYHVITTQGSSAIVEEWKATSKQEPNALSEEEWTKLESISDVLTSINEP